MRGCCTLPCEINRPLHPAWATKDGWEMSTAGLTAGGTAAQRLLVYSRNCDKPRCPANLRRRRSISGLPPPAGSRSAAQAARPSLAFLAGLVNRTNSRPQERMRHAQS